jgi:transposase
VFIRRKKNKSGSVSIQIIDKSVGKYSVVATLGCAKDEEQERLLIEQAYELFPALTKQGQFDFKFSEDDIFLQQIRDGFRKIHVVGPELVLGKIFDDVGYQGIPSSLFRHLVITRLVYPGSKLKTAEYLQRHKGIYISADKIYRYLDKFNFAYQQTAIELTFKHTKQILEDQITVAFYDITTLYFEASDEDDLRKLGFSKDGKAQNPQILLALLVGAQGQPLAYEVFKGDTFEGHTFIPVIQAFKKKYNLPSLVIVADAGLLSKENIAGLITIQYPFILGARLKNEKEHVRSKILMETFNDGKTLTIQKENNLRLIINYSAKRARKDEHQRKQGLERLEKSLRTGKLTKNHINNRGYNKYLTIKNEIAVSIDYKAYKADSKWNGLKGYVTNSSLSEAEIIDNYRHLWTIEKAFRISKTDLRIRPIYHRLERRIKTHICIAFCSYKIYKELERLLSATKAGISVEQALRELQTIYQATVMLPKSRKKANVLLPLTERQALILKLLQVKF